MIRSSDKETSPRPAVALVSGGLDSVVSLAIADKEQDVKLILFCNYGQRSLVREQASVVDIAGYYGLPLREVDIGWMRSLSPRGMRGPDEWDATAGRAVDRDTGAGDTEKLESLDDVWVPNRNGVFLNVAASFAESYGCDLVVTGFNREEAAEFGDNSPEYVDAVNRGFELSTRNSVRVVSYTQHLSKREIIRKGIEVGVPFDTIWSCYRGGDRMCGRCQSCLRLKSAIDSLPVEDRPIIEFEA